MPQHTHTFVKRRPTSTVAICACGQFRHCNPNAEIITEIPAFTGHLQHRVSDAGPFRTEAVAIRHEGADRYLARFEGKWRRVHIQVNRTFIVYNGLKITIQIDGV